MTKYRITQHLTKEDAAYIAGLVDGEGTITLTKKHRNENRQLALTISSTERQLLDYVLKVCGVGKITNKRAYTSAHTRSFTFAVHNRQALSLLAQLFHYLKSYKVRRARLVLEHYLSVTPRNGKYNSELALARERFEKAFFEIRSDGAQLSAEEKTSQTNRKSLPIRAPA